MICFIAKTHKTHETGIAPKDFEKCVIIPIPNEKKKPKKCDVYRAIRLITHASKIFSKIMHIRIESKINGNLTED